MCEYSWVRRRVLVRVQVSLGIGYFSLHLFMPGTCDCYCWCAGWGHACCESCWSGSPGHGADAHRSQGRSQRSGQGGGACVMHTSRCFDHPIRFPARIASRLQSYSCRACASMGGNKPHLDLRLTQACCRVARQQTPPLTQTLAPRALTHTCARFRSIVSCISRLTRRMPLPDLINDY